MTRYISLAEYFWRAEQVTRTGSRGSRQGRAGRPGGLGAARAASRFRRRGLLPDAFDKASVLTCRLAWNHPLPDGNKRAAWAALAMFVDLNDGHWEPDPPDVDEAEAAMLSVWARDVDEEWFATWLRERVRFD